MDEPDGCEDGAFGEFFGTPSVFGFSAGGCTLTIEQFHADDADWRPIPARSGDVPLDPTLGVRIKLKFDSAAVESQPPPHDHLRRDSLDGASSEA